MNSWFTVKVKYIKQLDDGTFKRVTEPYLLAAMTFTDAEARIYEELGALIRGEFIVTGITRTDIHDIFHYEDSDVWWLNKIEYVTGDIDNPKPRKVTNKLLVTAHSVKEAEERIRESLGGLLVDFEITSTSVSPIVDVFPFGDEGEDRVAAEFERQVKKEVAEHVMGKKTVFSAAARHSYGEDDLDESMENDEDDSFGDEEDAQFDLSDLL